MDKTYKPFAMTCRISAENVYLDTPGQKIVFGRDEISEITMTMGGVDMLFKPRKNIRIRLRNKKKYDLKRLKKSDALEIYNELKK